MGLSFSATSSKGEAQRESEGDAETSLKPEAEEALINSLLDDIREVTAPGPVANRGDAFYNQFSIGLFAPQLENSRGLTQRTNNLSQKKL